MYYLLKSLLAWFVSQLVKLIIESVMKKKIDITRIMEAGGMPSSHAALTVTLTVSLWRDFGINDPLVGAAAVFTLVILYDAVGIRRAAGKHAAILNKITEELLYHKPLTDKRLKELLGHTPFQVFAGVVLGLFLGFVV
ncbi:MAG: divergent PAP2 family protein [Dehalobacterium sp.]